MQVQITGVKPIVNSLEDWNDQNGRFRNVEFANADAQEWFSEKGNRFINFGKLAFVMPGQIVKLQLENPNLKLCELEAEVTGKGKEKKPTGLYTIKSINDDGTLKLKLDKDGVLSVVN